MPKEKLIAKCINATGTRLKLGEVVEVEHLTKDYYVIRDGKHYGEAFNKNRFELIEEDKNNG